MELKKILLIFLLAFFIRSLFLLNPFETADSDEYKLYATNLLRYHTFSSSKNPPILPSTFRTPIYPMFVTSIYFLFGTKDIFVYLFQVIIGSLTCIVLYFLTLDLFHNRKIATLTGLLCAMHPFLYFLTSSLMTETLFTFLLSVTILMLVKTNIYKSIKMCFCSGVFLGITTLCRPTTQFLPLFVLLIMVFILMNKKLFVRYSLIFILGFILSILPWVARNYIVTNEFIPISGGRGVNLYLATLNSEIYHDVKNFDAHDAANKDELYKRYIDNWNTPGVIEIEREMWKKAIARIKKRPFEFMLKRLKIQPFLWVGSSYLINLNWSEVFKKDNYIIFFMKLFILLFFHILPILMYLFGGWLIRKKWKKYILVYFIPIYFALVYFPIHTEMRYSIPAYPYVLLFSSYVIYYFYKKFTRKISNGNVYSNTSL